MTTLFPNICPPTRNLPLPKKATPPDRHPTHTKNYFHSVVDASIFFALNLLPIIGSQEKSPLTFLWSLTHPVSFLILQRQFSSPFFILLLFPVSQTLPFGHTDTLFKKYLELLDCVLLFFKYASTLPIWIRLALDLEKEMAAHSSTLAWRIPGTREPDGLPSLGSHKVGHDWSDLAAAVAAWSWKLGETFLRWWCWSWLLKSEVRPQVCLS